MAVKTSWAAGDVLTAADLTDTIYSRAPLALSINAQTGTSYTLAVADSGKVVTMTNAAASTVTIPTNATVAVPIGSSVEVVNLSTGVNTTVSAAGGVTFNGGPVVLSPGSSVTLVKIGTDAWMAQGQGAPGMVHIATQTFTTASSVSVNNCFTTAYDNYLIQMDCSAASASSQIAIRLRASGSDNATAGNYLWGGSYTNLTGAASVTAFNGGASATGFFVWYGNSTAYGQAYIFSPALTRLTRITSTSGNLGSDASWTGGNMSVTTAYDGFSIVPASGTLTGTVRVFGLRN